MRNATLVLALPSHAISAIDAAPSLSLFVGDAAATTAGGTAREDKDAGASKRGKRATGPPPLDPAMPPPPCTWILTKDGAVGITVANTWSGPQRRVTAVRVVLADGGTQDIPTASLRNYRMTHLEAVPNAAREAVGQAVVLQQAALFPGGTDVPDLAGAGVVFPAGSSPPPPTRPSTRPAAAGPGA